MDAQDQQLLRIVSEVLHYIWDPIQVSGVPQARDEYEGYVGLTYSLLRSGASETDISEHLQRIADERMGLPSRKQKADLAASVLVDWRDFLSGVGA
ncbi:hypothetical protein P873_14590 [Arenimonas composti TR7-09 = DSM 18010]|uniref:Uncharacterized protein n=1 Tax=Arenimonas composti TR7-09 = DSM 18010 TaxID=1121013 RepID=A0A091B2G0_9GAMM|nr:hypothetical protein P873_14590 [Arenimonas composti TR7-09 = DSM 18010]